MRLTSPPMEPRPWKAGVAWLAVLGPFFFASYGFANWAASHRASVPAIVFDWEHAIPFLPWTIVPYWLIDLLYGISLVLCATRAQLRTHVARLLFVQIVAVAYFLAMPLRFTFERPAVDGTFVWMFTALESFDQPYNQMPSLHVALLVVLWPIYLRALPKAWHPVVHTLGALIGISVLTVWQHHFIDMPTGAWLGCLAVWLFRDDEPRTHWRFERCRDLQRRKLAAYYGFGAIASCGIGLLGNGAWLWMLWPATSLALVAIVYLFSDGRAYGKRADGTFAATTWILFAPYFVGAWVNARLWTRHLQSADEVSPGIFLGSLAREWRWDDRPNASVIDLCAEYAGRQATTTRSIPLLDLVLPDASTLQEAVLAIEAQRRHGPVLIACALGFSRSAAAVAAWMVHAGIAKDIEDAIASVQRSRPAVVLRSRYVDRLRDWQQTYPKASAETAAAAETTCAVSTHAASPTLL